MNKEIILDPGKKDTLGKTFVRGVVGGIGWTTGLAIGSILLFLLGFILFERLGLSSWLDESIKKYIEQTIKLNSSVQTTTLDQLETEVLKLNNKGLDFYQEDITNLLNQNKL